MNEKNIEHYFTAVRIALTLIIVVNTVISCSLLTGASVRVLLLLALFTGSISLKEIVKKRAKKWFLLASVIIVCVILAICGTKTIMLGVLTALEIISFIRPSVLWYFTPLVMSLVNKDSDPSAHLTITLLLSIIYIQHDHIVEYYHKRTKEDDANEQMLKHDIGRKETEMKAELQRSLLTAENQVLEERALLSQTLHDKLGHNINGSVYQLEAVKLLMEKDPEKSKTMIQAVIDQLRTGMDEIRAILRNKRPEKHRLAAAQLENLCEDCRTKGIDAKLEKEGEMSLVPEKYLEIILDNCFEAVSNSLKYSGCSKILIKICVMNKFVRCSISDNGNGCTNVTDGMGISGMRRRVRQVNGILEINPEMGFMVNMILPLSSSEEGQNGKNQDNNSR